MELIAAKNDLQDFLEGWKDKIIGEEEKDSFKSAFSEKFKKVYGCRAKDKTADQIYGLDIMKKRLKENPELGFILENGKHGWILRGQDEAADNDRKD